MVPVSQVMYESTSRKTCFVLPLQMVPSIVELLLNFNMKTPKRIDQQLQWWERAYVGQMQHGEIEIIRKVREEARQEIQHANQERDKLSTLPGRKWEAILEEVPAMRMIMILMMMTPMTTLEIISMARVMKMAMSM